MSIASLPMYDWPECRPETLALWDRIRAGLPGLPEGLTTPADVHSHWRDPALVFSQTCWGPLSLGLIEALEPLAQPDYSAFEGGRGPFYRSALVMRQAAAGGLADWLAGRRLAVNGTESLSGYLTLQKDLGAAPETLASELVVTGAHRASVRAVAEGRADIAAIDCRSWAMALAHEPCAKRLVVVGWTSERPGLPYVTSRATDPGLTSALRAHLLNIGCHPVAQGGNQ